MKLQHFLLIFMLATTLSFVQGCDPKTPEKPRENTTKPKPPTVAELRSEVRESQAKVRKLLVKITDEIDEEDIDASREVIEVEKTIEFLKQLRAKIRKHRANQDKNTE